jgi:hypothetical protein
MHTSKDIVTADKRRILTTLPLKLKGAPAGATLMKSGLRLPEPPTDIGKKPAREGGISQKRFNPPHRAT